MFFRPVLETLARHAMGSDDLRAILRTELGEGHCFATKPTEKYVPGVMSDYYAIWVDDCGARDVPQAAGQWRAPVVTSFKEDDRHG